MKKSVRHKLIWIIDHYSSEPRYGGISRQYDFAVELGRRGYRVVVISSGFSHFTHSYISDKKAAVTKPSKGVRYVYLKTRSYSSNNGMGRARNMLNFTGLVMRYEGAIAQKFGKPDVVMGCSVHPMAWIAAYTAARRYRVRFVAEIRDLWPQVWLAGGMKSWHPMAVFFSLLERWVFCRADGIIYSLYHGDRYICGKKGVSREKVFRIGQPMDCARFEQNSGRRELLPEGIREFISEGFICCFTGYYMAYEGVYIMLEAMKILQEEGIPVKMVFVGSGQEKEGMLRFSRHKGLKNVWIGDRIPREAVPALLCSSHVCIASVRGKDGEYQYGVSKNKLNEYLYSGACTLFGFSYQEDEVTESGGGMVYDPDDPRDLAEKIRTLYEMPEKARKEMGEKGKAYMEKYHSVEVLTDRVLEALFGTEEHRRGGKDENGTVE